MKKRLKINGLLIILAILVLTIFPSVFIRRNPAGAWEEIIEITGVVLILLGQSFRVSGRGYKIEHSQQGGMLIQGGPYSVVRNPMYLGILLIGLGIVLMLFKWWVASIFLAVFITRYIILIFQEEKKLLSLFPLDCPAYYKKVPRLIPSLKVILDKDVSEYLPLKIAWLKREIGTIVAVLFITLFVESWEDILTEGIAMYIQEGLGMLVVIILFACLMLYLSKRTESQENGITNKSKST